MIIDYGHTQALQSHYLYGPVYQVSYLNESAVVGTITVTAPTISQTMQAQTINQTLQAPTIAQTVTLDTEPR